jgi:hypothetical protein
MKKVVFSSLEEVEVEVVAETFHTWNITDWKTLSNKVNGPVFECGGHSWCVYLTPSPGLSSFEVVESAG